MRRVSVDIGGTFTDCFVVWDGKYIEAKALTTHHNLALGFNEALSKAYHVLGLELEEILSQVDSVRYATTLGTNALIEHKGPKIGMLVTAGYEATVPLSRARGYGEGLDNLGQQDMPNAQRPVPLVLAHMIRGVRERVDFQGELVMALDEDDVRTQIRELVDRGAEIIVVNLVNCGGQSGARAAHRGDSARGISVPPAWRDPDHPVPPGGGPQRRVRACHLGHRRWLPAQHHVPRPVGAGAEPARAQV
jgi:N-methylhydantoinase A